MTRILQPSMSGGELSPGLQGRVDMLRYPISLATCKNVITKPTGGAEKRPGLLYRGRTKSPVAATRLIPFIYSTGVKYLIEMGYGYMRFWVNGALLRDDLGGIVEVPTPYTGDMIYDVRYTQSADVLYLTHVDVSPRELRRTSATTFELRSFEFRRGPFRATNSNDSFVMAASGVIGQVVLTCNTDVFSEAMVGSLVYMEEQELRGVKPWVAAEKNVPLNAYRRSDQKVYRCVSVPDLAGLSGTPYYVCGSVRPVHDSGRAFDGPQDVKFDNVNDYVVGVEWEYVHGGFGILKIDSFITAKQVNATVIERIPDSITGTAPTPGATWNLTGNGTTTTFAIAGATSSSQASYTVTIDGVPVAGNPNAGSPEDEWCVDADSFLTDGRRAGEIAVGQMLACYNDRPEAPAVIELPVQANRAGSAECLRLVTASGAAVVASTTTPMTLRDGRCVRLPQMLGEQALVLREGVLAWEEVVSLEPAGTRTVAKISVRDQCYFAGEVDGVFIATHNIQQMKP
ncbi:hypothetical protein A9K58_00450 [Stenotrophomonas maltophilia]|uniref:Uncharacterized protein n=1 Tax=Stenotrophomonas maltophilia TaxID=40324 RepID=A0A1A6Y6S5_STEMA|nr:hypothetical protein [Stenotrophomonas maltophilia]OBU70456.1 hypothetical protein A9K58_00450 [Stenotrophomonas maltophilia]